jgi:hypothetical protein
LDFFGSRREPHLGQNSIYLTPHPFWDTLAFYLLNFF